MELILSTIAAGGLVGAADQYLCLMIMGLTSRLGIVTLMPQMHFMQSWWFLGIVALFWVITVVPAYLSSLDLGVLKVFNTVANFISGFLVPASAALVSLASIGIITSLHPDLKALLETLRILGKGGNIAATGWAIAGGGAVTAASLTGMRFLAKPAATASVRNLAAPAHATYENTASLVLMSLAYALSKINPWLLVGLLALVVILTVTILVVALLQLRRLKKGLGRTLHLTQTHPRAGLAVIAEFFLWGVGWLIWKAWARGALMLVALAVWWALFLSLEGLVAALFVPVPPLIPVAMATAAAAMVMVFVSIGFASARALLRTFDTP
ncbi:MAG: DUF4126 family protein [Chloroflexota bacterium]